MIKLVDILNEIIEEKEDRCLRIARRKYDKPSAYRSGAIVRCRQGKIWKGLNEIGDASVQPYSFSFYDDYGDVRVYGFDTEHYPYSVELRYDEDTPNEVSVRFYITNSEDPDRERDHVVTNKGELFKVMSTITHIIKKDLKAHPEIDTITFKPAKKSGETTNVSRLNLYLKYIKNSYPGAEITTSPDGSTTVKIK